MDARLVSRELISCFKKGKKCLIIGNGGSAAEASHLAAELINKVYTYRQPLPAISLSADLAVITSIANDLGFKYVFSRQIEALGKPGDVLISLSTSGKSKNILEAIKTAQDLGLKVISFPTNKETGTPTTATQHTHLTMIHEISMQVEEYFL